MPLRAFVVLLGVLLLATPTRGQTREPERNSLKGIGPVRVEVEGMHPDLEREGLTQEMLTTAVEIRLRQNGIPLTKSLSPNLYVNVNGVKNARGLYAYRVDVKLVALVTILATEQLTFANVWDTELVGMVGAANLRDVRDDVLDKVDQFSNAYLAVNPK